MSAITVTNWKKEVVGEISLDQDVFFTEVRKDVLHTVVRWQLACRRRGTHMVKTKSMVSGGGKKPFKQKGTGNARQGSTRSPLMPGGAKLFGPSPRDYSYVLPKKVRRLGLRMALSYLNNEGRLFVVDSMISEEGKTKELNKRFQDFGLKKSLLVDSSTDVSFKRASQNLYNYKYMAVEGLNVHDILKYDSIVIAKDSISKIVEKCNLK